MTAEGQDGKLVMSVSEAAEALGISERTLWQNTAPRGGIPVVKVGRRVLYDPQDLRVWLNSQKLAGAA